MHRGSFSHKKYSYSHHNQKGPSQAIDVHDIFMKKNKTRVILSYVGNLVFLANTCYSLLVKEELSTSSFWIVFVGVLFAKCLQYKPVKKGTVATISTCPVITVGCLRFVSLDVHFESVVIMPTFGVQLETHFWRIPVLPLMVCSTNLWIKGPRRLILAYGGIFVSISGRVIHRFVPIGKILRPVLNECVTPVTCYWSLALMLRGEENLLLVFQELQPPVKMLVPVWKALCAATNGKEISSS